MSNIDSLIELMSKLRDPVQGCPWDLKQSIASLLPHTLEEVYDVADAIESGSMVELEDELGDLLFQIVFYAQLAREEGSFDFDDIAAGVTKITSSASACFSRWDTCEFRRDQRA